MEQVIINNCQSTLKEYEVPKYFRIVDSLPYTQNGKYDFVQLEKEGNEYTSKLMLSDKKILYMTNK